MASEKPLNKKRKLEPSKKLFSVDDIRESLRTQNSDALVEALNQLRNQHTIRSDEGVIAPQDERLLLVEQWLERNPGVEDVFALWENANPRQPNLQVAIVSVLAVLLTLLSSHYTYHALGYPIVKSLLSPQWMRRLNSYVVGTHNELTLVTFKLLNAISGFAGGREKKTLLEVFQWEIKSLPKLLALRRKGKVDYHPLTRPDIRTLYILFLLSFLDGQTQVKSTFLEQHRDAFLSIFKGLPQDHYLFIRHVLEVMWTNLWSDPKVKRTTKVGLFNESSISHLLKIYNRTSSNDDDPEHIPADLVHHFFLAIMTRPGVGICFRDRGWYPRVDAEDEKGGKIHNKILANILKSLKVNEDSRQQELARRILEACPELVAGYWPSAQLTLEPRLSTKWIANIAFFGTVTSTPVPQSTFYLLNTELYNPTPPPLQTILSNILPSDISPKTIFTKGLLSSVGLVQHCTALTLGKCLMKYAEVLQAFRVVEEALEVSDTEEGLWARRRREMEKEVRRRVPGFQVVLGFSQPKTVPVSKGVAPDAPAPPKTPNPVRNALLQECAQRLLLLYHKYLPEVVAEARFDVGKTLVNFDAAVASVEEGADDIPEAAKSLQLVQRLHVLRTLKESDQFVWTNKTSSSRTYLYAILKSYTSTVVPALKSTLLDLLSHLLSSSILFEETPTEPRLWLTSLPCSLRAPNATSPDNVSLTNEADSVVAFLDDCIQRCLKTPFRYIEEMRSGNNSSSSSDVDAEIYPSPLIMTISEQLDAKIKARLLTPSDILAITSFVRQVMFRLSGQVRNLRFLEAFVVRMDQILGEPRLWQGEHLMMTRAVRTEVKMMYAVARPALQVEVEVVPNPNLQDYLEQIESLPSVDRMHEQALQAHSIIDRLRFFDQPLTLSDAKRLILAVQTHWAPALPILARYIFPRTGSFWENHILVGTDIRETIPIEWLFFNASEEQLHDPDYRRSFIANLFTTKVTLQSCMALIRHIEHRLDSTDTLGARGLLSLLAILLSEARSVFDDAEMRSLKELLFVRSGAFKRLAMDSSIDERVHAGIHELLQSSFDPCSSTDRRILSEISAHWLGLLHSRLNQQDINLNLAALWTKFLPPARLLHLFDQLVSHIALSNSSHLLPLVQSTLTVIRTFATEDASVHHALWERIPQLLEIRTQLPGSPEVEELVLIAVDSTLPVGLSASRWNCVSDDQVPFAVEIQRASLRWTMQSLRLTNAIPAQDILASGHWTPWTAEIITSLAYKQGLDMEGFEKWLKSEYPASRSIEDVAKIVHAVLDIHRCTSLADDSLDPTAWMPHLKSIVPLCFNHDLKPSLRRIASSCITLGLKALIKHQQDLILFVNKQIDLHRLGKPTPECVQMGIHSSVVSSPLLDWALHWLIGYLDDDAFLSTQTQPLIEHTIPLVQVSVPKSHQVETLLGVIVQHHLACSHAVELANACISRTYLKPVVVNRYLQNIMHHSQFFNLANGTNSNPDLRIYIVRLLHTLFNLHPTNTCQITQVEPLLRIYRGTLAEADLLIFSIFQLFEIHRKLSLASLFSHWSSADEITCSSALESLQSLDSVIVFRTTLHYPKWRKLQTEFSHPTNSHDRQLYDPIFLLLLSHLALSQDPPYTAFGWIDLFRTNIVGMCVRGLSSKDPALRALSLSQLTAMYKSIENLIFQEKAHIIYIFDLLKDLFTMLAPNDPPARLPSYTTLILAHALRGLFYPSNFIYPLTARFLLQRPELDPGDVPMLYTMLYSNADEWKKDRGWIIRFLADGMVSSDDWRVLKRRHAWDLLASLFQSSGSDLVLRKGIFEVMANLTCNRQAVTSMIFQSSFLVWMEMEIRQRHDDESPKWTRLLANIVITIDHSKFDLTFQGSWRDSIHRCLSTLLNGPNADLILPTAATVIFKLSQSSNTLTFEAQECIRLAAHALDVFETHLNTQTGTYGTAKVKSCITHNAFPSHSIHEPLAAPYSYETWLDCVTFLWRTTMVSELRTTTWDVFTFKLLASHHRTEGNHEAEWIRSQILSLQSHERQLLPGDN